MKIKKIFKKAFLPNDYPQSVSDDYLEYQCWDSLQAFCSSIMNNLATQALFKGVGVGNSSATILAATITWILKDGTSIIGSLIFATIQCTRMDSDCKKWRLFADIINDLAIMIDLFSPIFNGLQFTLVQCLSGTLRSLVGIAGGATRAALTQHQAKCNNMADVSAKDQSQERIVNLFSLIFSLIFIPFINDEPVLTWSMFFIFTIGHIYSNYRAIRSIRFNVFNRKRLALFLQNFHSNNIDDLSIKSINLNENIWFFRQQQQQQDRIFENVYFIQNKQQQTTTMINDPINNRFQINYDEIQNEYRINTTTTTTIDTIIIIESLCLLFLLKNQNFNDENIDNIKEFHRKLMPKIWKTFDDYHWDYSHVLMAEIIINEDDCDHEKFD